MNPSTMITIIALSVSCVSCANSKMAEEPVAVAVAPPGVPDSASNEIAPASEIPQLRREIDELDRENQSLLAASAQSAADFAALKNEAERLRDEIGKLNHRSLERAQERAESEAQIAESLGDINSGMQALGDELSSANDQALSNRENIETTRRSGVESKQALSDDLNAAIGSMRAELGALDTGPSEGRVAGWTILSAILAALLMGTLVYRVMDRRLRVSGEKMSRDLEGRFRGVQEDAVRTDNKLLQLAEQQLQAAGTAPASAGGEEGVEHSVPLRVADELVRLNRNFSQMSAETRGLKQLKASARRIKDTLEVGGYEVVELLGQPFDPGMKIRATFKEDETLPEGAEVVTRIIKPQVNYRGKMIQAAQVEVSQGTKE